jgi:YVTN family beta-propeller protein
VNASVYGNVDLFTGSGYGAYYGTTSGATASTPGTYLVWGPDVPANWSHDVWLSDYCDTPAHARALSFQGYQTVYQADGVLMENGSNYLWICDTNVVPPNNTSFSQFAIEGSVPSSITLPEIPGGGPFSVASGPPELQIYTGANGVPSLYFATTAYSVDPSGDSATFAVPSSMPQGAYALVASNENPDGTYSTNAYNVLTVAGSQTIAGHPFGVAAEYQTDNYTYCYIEQDDGDGDGGQRECDSGQSTYAAPVVTLYSMNEVLIGGAPIGVGQNPTAVVTNSNGSEQIYSPDGESRDTYSGTTLAVVANSGGNTISLVDTAQYMWLTDITVGNQPVALAMRSDGNTVYVANYKDGTVSRVNLNTDTVTGSVAVGGQPTSVALTAGGVLWAGGVGFLTEVNTQTMTVVATQATGKTVIALGYSDGENELIATTADANGNVYVDEVAPASVQTGSEYAPAASHTASSLGSYLNQSTGTNVQGYTALLASAAGPNSISAMQIGTPPIVVQDGWAVVSSTPTGFTISEASGNAVLISATTPSPVTGIAVDTNLNNAYLVMPDSNTLLTVPLPGTGTN